MAEIVKSERPVTNKDFWSFGELLAYCYYFGLQDIHKSNVLLVESGLQVIDVEQVFSDLTLPNQTLMLPVNKVVTWSSALNILTLNTIDEISKEQALELINGFQFMSNFFISKLMQIREIISAHRESIFNQPIRVFVRGTKEYSDYLNKKLELEDLFQEEKVQLERNDVPYFFTYLGHKNIYYYTNECWDSGSVGLPIEFDKNVNFCAVDPMSLLDESKMHIQYGKGILYLAKKMKKLDLGDIDWENIKISKFGDKLQFQGFGFKISS